jgi:hypothetical protein
MDECTTITASRPTQTAGSLLGDASELDAKAVPKYLRVLTQFLTGFSPATDSPAIAKNLTGILTQISRPAKRSSRKLWNG